MAAAAVALLLAGCQTLGAPRDSRIISGVPAAKADAAALFSGLQRPAPDCTAAANAAGLGKVQDDLAGLTAAAQATPGNSFSQRGFAKLQSSYGAFRQGVEAGGARCTPPAVVSDYGASFNRTLDDLLSYEQRKPEPRP